MQGIFLVHCSAYNSAGLWTKKKKEKKTNLGQEESTCALSATIKLGSQSTTKFCPHLWNVNIFPMLSDTSSRPVSLSSRADLHKYRELNEIATFFVGFWHDLDFQYGRHRGRPSCSRFWPHFVYNEILALGNLNMTLNTDTSLDRSLDTCGLICFEVFNLTVTGKATV